MELGLVFMQLLNGLQLGVLLFILAAGLSLVFGIMNFVNLAHGSIYMLGAYFSVTAYSVTKSFTVAMLAAVAGTMVVGFVIEKFVVSHLYSRSHLDQVLATFGMVLFFNEIVTVVWGPQPYSLPTPSHLGGSVEVLGVSYPAYRFVILAVGVCVAFALHLLMHRTRLGMLIRAGASNPKMAGALGVNLKLLNAALFVLGAALAGVAGVMAGPILSIESGMGEPVLITALVVIVIGGIGSVKGALYGALMVGVADTLGRAFLPMGFREIMSRDIADAAGPAVASMLVYVLMAAVLAVRPRGLFPEGRG
ncbi:branched-chain amino acid ABC transporter permease [Caballeronia sp. KNU42]